VRGMLSDRARTELSVAVDIFQESLLYTCITKEYDHLMCHIANDIVWLKNEGFHESVF
jgi:hypothetical protein